MSARERFEISGPIEIRRWPIEKFPLQKIPRLLARAQKTAGSNRAAVLQPRAAPDVTARAIERWRSADRRSVSWAFSTVCPSAQTRTSIGGSPLSRVGANTHRQPARRRIEHGQSVRTRSAVAVFAIDRLSRRKPVRVRPRLSHGALRHSQSSHRELGCSSGTDDRDGDRGRRHPSRHRSGQQQAARLTRHTRTRSSRT